MSVIGLLLPDVVEREMLFFYCVVRKRTDCARFAHLWWCRPHMRDVSKYPILCREQGKSFKWIVLRVYGRTVQIQVSKKKHDTLAMVPCRRTMSSRNSWRRKCTMFACFLCRKTIYLLRSSRATSAPARNKQIKQNSDTSLPAWFTENPPNALSELILKYIPLLFRPN